MGRVFRLNSILVQLLFERREVQEPVPKPADNPGCDDIANKNGPHPRPSKLLGGSIGWIITIGVHHHDSKQRQQERPSCRKHGRQMPNHVQIWRSSWLCHLLIVGLCDCRKHVPDWPLQSSFACRKTKQRVHSQHTKTSKHVRFKLKPDKIDSHDTIYCIMYPQWTYRQRHIERLPCTCHLEQGLLR